MLSNMLIKYTFYDVINIYRWEGVGGKCVEGAAKKVWGEYPNWFEAFLVFQYISTFTKINFIFAAHLQSNFPKKEIESYFRRLSCTYIQ